MPAYKIRKVNVEFVRSTSLIRPAFRYEVPLLKLVAAKDGVRINIHDIQRPSAEEIGEFNSPAAAYDILIGVHGAQDVMAVYPTFETFKKEFEAVARRDHIGSLPEPIDEEAATQLAIDSLCKIDGVTPDIARTLFAAGFNSVEAVAATDLNELETVNGVSPSVADQIKASAFALIKSMNPESGVAPVAPNPFAQE
jgi:predicted flap endonuclease-1-like 5' DNA nuclease